jgi:hypothetical protein
MLSNSSRVNPKAWSEHLVRYGHQKLVVGLVLAALVYYWCMGSTKPSSALPICFYFGCKTAALRSGAEGIRTPDLRRAKAALSRLSYGPDLASWGEFTAVAQGELTGLGVGGCAGAGTR